MPDLPLMADGWPYFVWGSKADPELEDDMATADSYTPRFTRQPRPEGHGAGIEYAASFGRGKKKLTAIIAKYPKGYRVRKGACPLHLKTAQIDTLREIKDEWGGWAKVEWRRRWEDGPPVSKMPVPPVPTACPPVPDYHPGPRPASPRVDRARPEFLDYEHGVDPFDARFKYGYSQDAVMSRQLTPLGVVGETVAWILKHPDVMENPALTPIWNTARECLHREAPDAYEKLMKGNRR